MPIQLDPTGYKGIMSPCSPDPQVRAHAIDLTKQWMDRTAMIQCPSVMPNQGCCWTAILLLPSTRSSRSPITAPQRTFRSSWSPGERLPLDTLLKVIKEAGIYANPDIGNFGNEENTERGLRLMYPLAKTVSHVKWNPEKFSFATAIGISKEMGFKGVYSIESGGPEPYAMQQQLLDYCVANL